MLSPKLRITNLSITQPPPKPLPGIRSQLAQVFSEASHFINYQATVTQPVPVPASHQPDAQQ